MRIPQWPIADHRERELIDEVLNSPQWGGYHEFVSRFERQFANFQHCRHGVSAANGTVTLEMLLNCTGIKLGDEVIVPAISFVSTATAVTRVGAIPVFVDIEPYSFNIDPERIEAAITPKTKAIMPVHFGGPLADMDRIMDIAARHNLIVLEDAAHAQGSEWKGRRAGSIGLASSFSFQNGKVMTAGEGGIVLTGDDTLAADLRSFANCGRRPGATFFHHFVAGANLRLSGLHAAVLLAQIERLPAQVALRTRNAAILMDRLQQVDGIHWQQIDKRVTANSWYLVLGRVDEKRLGMSRDEFHRLLGQAQVPCTPFYPHTLYQNPLYQHSPCRVEPCPNAEACIRDAFWLPHYLLLGDEELMHQVAAVITGAVRVPVRP